MVSGNPEMHRNFEELCDIGRAQGAPSVPARSDIINHRDGNICIWWAHPVMGRIPRT